ncbi:MAG TPA: PAS domain S-box protein [Armatimonadota bacterium]|nr:PAS domain S-box protein [Armatimonadota bacterium]
MNVLNTLKKAQKDASATRECSETRACCTGNRANNKARWSCNYFQTILAHIQDAVIVVDNYTDEILGANKAFFQIWGIEQYEESVRQGGITASALCKVGQSFVRDTIAFAAANALLRDTNYRDVMRDEVLLVDGRVIACTSAPICDHLGQYHVRYHAFQDITERKRTENALRASEENYRTIFENTGTAMIIVEDDTTISLANTGFALLVGYTKKEIESCMSFLRFVHEEDRERIKRYHYLRRLTPDAAPRTYEVRMQDHQGQIRTMLATVAVIPGPGKSTGSFADITEQKETLEALRVSEERLQLAFAGADDGLWDWNIATGEMYYSDQWAGMLGYYRDELPPNIDCWYHMLHPDDLAHMVESLQAHLEGCADYFAAEQS